MMTDTKKATTSTNPFEIPTPPEPVPTPEQAQHGPLIIGASPVSGASTWAELLDLEEGDTNPSTDRVVLLVARTTETSLAAALELIGRWQDGGPVIAGILVVPDAPGHPARVVQHRMRVLSGAHPVIPVPWVPGLRGVHLSEDLTNSKPVAKAVQKITAAISARTVATL